MRFDTCLIGPLWYLHLAMECGYSIVCVYSISTQVEVSVCVTAVKDVSVSVTVGLPLSLERNTLVLTVAVILTTAIVRSTLGLGEREGFFVHSYILSV